ncbi:hypothetical protein CRENBAI_018863 [Crenichthys baileyi]|uniref:C2H2-type domain-containing protein n=1 Tax=Crenichthys baileyi TaxID=28760 RepID=A0AAV9R9Q4_9TELE
MGGAAEPEPIGVLVYDVPAANREAELKEGRGGVAEDGEQDERDDDDLDDESIFTCDNCQQDFDCLAELTEHRTNHCPAGWALDGSLSWISLAPTTFPAGGWCPGSVGPLL